jgi:hypothetical protein
MRPNQKEKSTKEHGAAQFQCSHPYVPGFIAHRSHIPERFFHHFDHLFMSVASSGFGCKEQFFPFQYEMTGRELISSGFLL